MQNILFCGQSGGNVEAFTHTTKKLTNLHSNVLLFHRIIFFPLIYMGTCNSTFNQLQKSNILFDGFRTPDLAASNS